MIGEYIEDSFKIDEYDKHVTPYFYHLIILLSLVSFYIFYLNNYDV